MWSFLPSFFSIILLNLIIFCFCQSFSWWVTFIHFRFHFAFLCVAAFFFFFSCQNCQPSEFFSSFHFPFVDSLVLLFYRQSQNECETSVSCGFTLFCTTFFFYVFVCYKLSWFINPSRLFKASCITKQEK